MNVELPSTAAVVPPPVPRIAWSKEQQAFVVVSAVAALEAAASDVPPRQQTLESELEDFACLTIESDDTAINSVDNFIQTREWILHRIRGEELEVMRSNRNTSSSALLFLPAFVADWESGLDRVARHVDEHTAVRICIEHYRLAEEAMLLGQVATARRALGRCIKIARDHRSATQSTNVENHAKTLLLQCVQFQYQLQRCEDGLKRHHVPFLIVQGILERLSTLADVAPHAPHVMVLKANALLAIHRSKEIVASLAGFAFTSSSAPLTLAYATALEYEGYFQQSIAVVTDFLASPNRHPAKERGSDPIAALKAHASHLTRLLAHKALGDDALAASRFDDAERAFDDALGMASPLSRRLRASLLLGRANARIGRERLLSAQSDLEASLRLDPSNQIARLRLRTVELAQETQHIQRRLVRS